MKRCWNRLSYRLKHQLHIWLTLTFISAYIFFSLSSWKNYENDSLYQFSADKAMYYSYLPAFLINNDPYFIKTTQPGAYFDLIYGEKKLPKFTIGMAVMYSPFFILASFFDPGTEELARFGLSKTYSRFIRIGDIFYFLIGLFFLLKLLDLFFRKSTVVLSGLLIFFGTNLLYYIVVQSEMPHMHLFALIAVILYCSHYWWETGRSYFLYVLSFLLGLIAIIRASDLIILMVPIFWGITNFTQLKERFQFILKHKWTLFWALLIFLAPILPQLLYWKLQTGSYLLYAYTDERFFLTDPKLWDFLFSYRKGWFVYTPLMFIACIGFFFMPKYLPGNKFLFPALIIINVYLFSSWWCWWFGGSFGSRGMVQFYAILIFPLASFIETILTNRSRFLIAAVPTFIFLVFLNINFTRKFESVQIHWDSMTKDAYWFTFLKFSFNKDDYNKFNKLLQAPNYNDAKDGKNR